MKKKIKLTFIILIFLILLLIFYLSKGNISFETNTKKQIEIEYQQDYQLPIISSSYHFAYINKVIEISNEATTNIDNTKLGEYQIIYTANFFFKKATTAIIVHVVDTTAPIITLSNNEDYWIFPDEEYIEEGYQAIDNYDGDITDKVEINNNQDGTITYTVTDSSSNKSEITRQIKYKDSNPPIITINKEYLAFKVGSSYTLPTYTAIDNEDGDLTDKVVVTNTINPNKVGCYLISYTVADKWNNIAKKDINVYVYRDNISNATTTKVNKSIYLTFDDGPSAYTSTLLDILDKYNVKVTFFVTNTKPSYQNMISEAYRRGHSIAVHSYTHNYAKIYASEQAFWEDNTKMNEVIYQQTGQYSNIMRFPGGTSNTVSRNYKKGIMTALAKSTSTMGFRYFDWNVDSNDAGGASSSQEVFNNVKKGCSSKSYCVVLQHDSKSFSVNAVEQIITWGLANGYTFLPITDTTPVTHHPSYN